MELEECEGLPPGVQCRSDGSFFHLSAIRLADIRDGLSNTLLAGERSSAFGHSGSVRLIVERIDLSVYRALVTRFGNEAVTLPD
jgi:hypothetical protein